MKKLLIAAAVVFATSTVTFAQKKKATGPAMKFKEEVHNFGTVREGVKVEHHFEFTNTGDAPLIITAAQGSCG